MDDSTTFEEALDALDGYKRDKALPRLREIGDSRAVDEILRVMIDKFEKPIGRRMRSFVQEAWEAVGELWSEEHDERLYGALRALPRHLKSWEYLQLILTVVAKVDRAWAADLLAFYDRALVPERQRAELAELLGPQAARPASAGDSVEIFAINNTRGLVLPEDERLAVGLEAALIVMALLRPYASAMVSTEPAHRFGVVVDEQTLRFRWSWDHDAEVFQRFVEAPLVEEGAQIGLYSGPISDEDAERAVRELVERRALPSWLTERLDYEGAAPTPAPASEPRSAPVSNAGSQPAPQRQGLFGRFVDLVKGRSSTAAPEPSSLDLGELEPQASRDPSSVSGADHDRLVGHYWQQATDEEDFRERQKLLKRAAFFVEHAVAGGVSDPERLSSYLDILEAAAEVQSDTAELRRVQAQIRFLQSGSAPRVRDSVSGNIFVDGGTVFVGDVDEVPNDWGAPFEETFIGWMQRGARLCVATGDGGFPVELRLVDGDGPHLPAEELAQVHRCSAAVVLDVPTGRLGMGELPVTPGPSGEGGGDRWTELQVAPGAYEACIYATPAGLVAVACPTTDSPPNDVRSLEEV